MSKFQTNLLHQTPFYLFSLCCILLTGCGSDDKGNQATSPSSIEQPVEPSPTEIVNNDDPTLKNFLDVIDNHCVQCHQNNATGNFRSLVSADDWRNSGYVVAGNPADSLIYQRLINNGGDMPLAGQALDDADLKIIEAFILSLAGKELVDADGTSYQSCQDQNAFLQPRSVRRLSDEEYKRTIRQITNNQIAEEQLSLVKSPKIKGMDNVWTELGLSRMHTEALARNAKTIAASLTNETSQYLPSSCLLSVETDCWKDLREEIAKLYKRPLSDQEYTSIKNFYSQARNDIGLNHKESLSFLFEAILQSPSFLYRTELGKLEGNEDSSSLTRLTNFEIANQLSYFLTGKLPDDELWQAAKDQDLSQADVREKQALRLMNSPDFSQHMSEFARKWLDLDQIKDIEKNPEYYPNATSELMQAFDQEISLLLQDYFGEVSQKVQNLLLSDYTFINRDLANFYEIPYSGEWQQSSLIGTERQGILSTAAFNTRHAHPGESSPILRGKLIAERLLCINLPRPPPNIDPLPAAESEETLSTRERVEQHVSNPNCASCHQLMDPLGFALEGFDAIGQIRTTQFGKPIDTQDSYEFDAGITTTYSNFMEMNQALADSQRFKDCMQHVVQKFAFGRTDQELSCSKNSDSKPVTSIASLFLNLITDDKFILRTQTGS